jgi:hypothetical protein
MFSKYATILAILRWLIVFAISSPSLCVLAPLHEMNSVDEKTSHAKTQRPQRLERLADSAFPVVACHRQDVYLPDFNPITDHR